MTNVPPTDHRPPTPANKPTLKLFGIGTAGISVTDQLIGRGFGPADVVAVSTDPECLAASAAGEKIHLQAPSQSGLGTASGPEHGRVLAEDQLLRFKELCHGRAVVFIVAGLGGGDATGISPVLARAAKESGALVLGFVTVPFDCEGDRRRSLAGEGLAELKAAADGVICLPNQQVLKLVTENTSVLETFRLSSGLLADAVRGLWWLVAHTSLIEIQFGELSGLLRDRHGESSFAVAEATGAARAREVVDKLLAHPLLEGGQRLNTAEAVLVGLMGGPDLAMTEVDRVIQHVREHCQQAQVIMGAGIEDGFRDRLAVTLIAAHPAPESSAPFSQPPSEAQSLNDQLLERSATPRPSSRFVPPPPELTLERIEKLLGRQAGGTAPHRKRVPKLKQTQLPLDIVSKGRFDKSEPTIHKGEDLDVPTYVRRGIPLN
jgi:cell division protein FtsZ